MARVDEKGHHIVRGAITFGCVVRPKGGRRQPRSTKAKMEASERLVQLMTRGSDGDPLTRKIMAYSEEETEDVLWRNKISRSSKRVQFLYYCYEYRKLEQTLNKLIDGGNNRKIDLMRENIEIKMREFKEKIDDVGQDLSNENL